MKTTYSLYIIAGVKVLSENKNCLVELLGDVHVTGATLCGCGGYIYSVGGDRFYASSGTVVATEEKRKRINSL